MYDSGFRKVFAHVVSSSSPACKSSAGCSPPPGLLARGESPEWARAVKHLISTAPHKGTAYFIVKQWGAWLATYASHILGMAVKILVKDVVIWESAGVHGVAIFQLEEFTSHLARPYGEDGLTLVHTKSSPQLVAGPKTAGGSHPMDATYSLNEALAKEFALYPEFTEPVQVGIQQAIYRLMRAATSRKLESYRRKSGSTYIDGPSYCPDDHILLVSEHMGLAEPGKLDRVSTGDRVSFKERERFPNMKGSRWISDSTASLLTDACGCRIHYVQTSFPDDHVSEGHCICLKASNLVVGIAATALALMQCVYDPLELQVSAAVISGAQMTQWTTAVSELSHIESASMEYTLFHLNELLRGPLQTALVDKSSLLAISAGSYSIYYRCLLDEECFDEHGRVLAIAPGRICMKGTLREYVKQNTPPDWMGQLSGSSYVGGISTKYQPGLEIEPHYASSDIGIKMDCDLRETEISFSCSITSNASRPLPVNILHSISLVLEKIVQPHCKHERDKAFVVRPEMGPVTVSTFFAENLALDYATNRGVQMFALRGCSIEQLVQLS